MDDLPGHRWVLQTLNENVSDSSRSKLCAPFALSPAFLIHGSIVYFKDALKFAMHNLHMQINA